MKAVPLAPSDSGAREPAPAGDAAGAVVGRKGCVLVVEDDPATQRALRLLLASAGWEVLVAGTVADGVRLLTRGPTWVVLDLMLPDGDGATVLREIRTAGLPIRVVVTTGTSDREHLATVEALRPHRLLRKPIDLDDLLGGVADID